MTLLNKEVKKDFIRAHSRQFAVKNASGFSLIEIIITLVVLSIAAVGVLSVFTTGIKGSADPLILNQALSLAEEKMDEAIGLKRVGGFAAVNNVAVTAFPAPFNGYTWERVVECLDTTLNLAACPTEYERVTINIAWNAGADTISLVTLIANY